jgi:LPS O-antigen subunit length determinant protein (WzzB/FepE family)
MNEPIETPVAPEAPKKSNTGLIIGIVVGVVILCCCCAVVIIGWQFGDQIMNALNF